MILPRGGILFCCIMPDLPYLVRKHLNILTQSSFFWRDQMLPEIKNGSILAQSFPKSISMQWCVHLLCTVSVLLSLFWNEWLRYEAPRWLTGPMCIHSMLTLQHRSPLVTVPRTVRVRRMQWKGPVASTGWSCPSLHTWPYSCPRCVGVLHSCLELPRPRLPRLGRSAPGGGRVHRCAVHMEGATSTVTATLESRCQCRKSRWQRNSSQRELDLQWILTLEKFFQAKRDSNWKKKKN